MATTPNYGWVMPDPTDFVTSLPADFEIFGDAVDATVDGIETTANAAQPNVITTEGDLVVGDASGDPIRLPIGAVGTVLTSDGDTAIWDTTVAGGMTLLSTTSLSGATVTISAIPSGYQYLVLYLQDHYPNTDDVTLRMQFNGDTGNNYSWRGMTANYSGTWTTHGATYVDLANAGTANETYKNADGNNSVVIHIHNYTSSFMKTGFFNSNFLRSNDSGVQLSNMGFFGYDDTTAITSITLFWESAADFSGGNAILYGVK
jgi:hypothetical protein